MEKKKTERSNNDLNSAKANKNDEFYTQLSSIEDELKHYKDHFKGKVIYCNCDDPYESNFFKYFAINFNRLGIKKLITTCYKGSPIITEQLSLFDVEPLRLEERYDKDPYKIEITKVDDYNNDGAIDLADVEYLLKHKENILTLLKGDGDFRSKECIKLLEEADIVITNPPFSLFREYLAQLINYNKNFIILGNMNAITYKEVFPLIKENKIWTGFKHFGGGMDMIQPKQTFDPTKTKSYKIDKNGNIIKNIMGVIWYTNLDISKRHEDLILYKTFDESEYPKYDNYDAREVSKVNEIPCDYEGIMGVPITFIDKYNPDQFEIIGATESEGKGFSMGLWKEESKVSQPLINGKKVYKRIFIKKRV